MEQLAVVRSANRRSFEDERSAEELVFDLASQPTRRLAGHLKGNGNSIRFTRVWIWTASLFKFNFNRKSFFYIVVISSYNDEYQWRILNSTGGRKTIPILKYLVRFSIYYILIRSLNFFFSCCILFNDNLTVWFIIIINTILNKFQGFAHNWMGEGIQKYFTDYTVENNPNNLIQLCTAAVINALSLCFQPVIYRYTIIAYIVIPCCTLVFVFIFSSDVFKRVTGGGGFADFFQTTIV